MMQKPIVLEADTVYLLMKKGFPISRNVRAQWVLKHLDAIISIQSPGSEVPELEIVSVIPKESAHLWCPENSNRYSYKVTSSTTVKFLAHNYRMVFCLDLSPSLATVVSIIIFCTVCLKILFWKFFIHPVFLK